MYNIFKGILRTAVHNIKHPTFQRFVVAIGLAVSGLLVSYHLYGLLQFIFSGGIVAALLLGAAFLIGLAYALFCFWYFIAFCISYFLVPIVIYTWVHVVYRKKRGL